MASEGVVPNIPTITTLVDDVLVCIFTHVLTPEGKRKVDREDIFGVMALRLTCTHFHSLMAQRFGTLLPIYGDYYEEEEPEERFVWWNSSLMAVLCARNQLPAFLECRAFMYNKNAQFQLSYSEEHKKQYFFRGQDIARRDPNHQWNAIGAMAFALAGGHEDLAIRILRLDYRLSHMLQEYLLHVAGRYNCVRMLKALKSYCRCNMCQRTSNNGTLVICIDIVREVLTDAPELGLAQLVPFEACVCESCRALLASAVSRLLSPPLMNHLSRPRNGDSADWMIRFNQPEDKHLFGPRTSELRFIFRAPAALATIYRIMIDSNVADNAVAYADASPAEQDLFKYRMTDIVLASERRYAAIEAERLARREEEEARRKELKVQRQTKEAHEKALHARLLMTQFQLQTGEKAEQIQQAKRLREDLRYFLEKMDSSPPPAAAAAAPASPPPVSGQGQGRRQRYLNIRTSDGKVLSLPLDDTSGDNDSNA